MIRQRLENFITIVEKGSFSAAADSLYISQSALSQQIRTFEKQLGFCLFEHNTHRVILTAAGLSFYPQAKQILASYNNAVQEARFAEYTSKAQKQRLRIGCLGEQFFRIWTDLFHLSHEINNEYAPVAMRFSNRTELYRALYKGNADLSIQIFDSDIAENGLLFTPLAYTRELCIPVYTEIPEGKDFLSVDELAKYRLAFHFAQGSCLYEDELRAELKKRGFCTGILEPTDFFGADYGVPTFLLVPEIYFNGNIRKTIPLRWKEGIPVGFVHGPSSGSSVSLYIEWIRRTFAQKGSPWTWAYPAV